MFPLSSQQHSSNNHQQAYLTTSNDSQMDGAWYVDSGATNHITTDPFNITHKSDYKVKS